MRFVKRNLADKPDILTETNTLSDIEKIAKGNIDIISDKIYKAPYKDRNNDNKTQSKVRDKLNEYYHNKCAYCETLCKAEIEHYRPKKGITKPTVHKGYYWLVYEWSNLLPSCRYCNTEGGKGNHFPILSETNRVDKPIFEKNGKLDKTKCVANNSPLLDEEPYLLHPEIDNPKNFLGFRLNTKKIGVDIVEIDSKINGKSRGSETIRILNLNRKYLRLSRFDKVSKFIKGAVNTMFKLRKDNLLCSDYDLKLALISTFQGLKDKSDDHKTEHTLLFWFGISTIERFNELICPLFEDKNQQEILYETFKVYLTKQQ